MKRATIFCSIAFPLSISILLISSCVKSDYKDNTNIEITDQLEERNSSYSSEFYALSDANVLLKYSSVYAMQEICHFSISGLQTMERLLAIDFRPATGQLYSVSNQNRIYTINPETGNASAVTMTPFTPAINGDQVGFDFNPTVDRIRLVSSNDQNLRLNPETGVVVAMDSAINPSTAIVSAVAYTNSKAGASTTTLYDIDISSQKLFIQTPPNNGSLQEVGSLGVLLSNPVGFDISPDNSLAMVVSANKNASEWNNEQSLFYKIDLATGQAEVFGKSRYKIISIAIPTEPVAYAVDQNNNLLIFNPFINSSIVSKSITGLQTDEKILGIDMRPATSQLYALGSTSRLYTLNMASGVATAIGAAPFSTLLNGTSFGFDFNPTVDRIRVVSNTGQNLRLHPVTGVVAFVDPSLNPGSPSVDAAAYTNSFAGATTTTLYDIDFKSNYLYKQDPANAGALIKVGYMGGKVSSGNGFDIGGQSNKGYGLFTFYNRNYVYKINLIVGMPTIVRPFPTKVNGFALGLGF